MLALREYLFDNGRSTEVLNSMQIQSTNCPRDIKRPIHNCRELLQDSVLDRPQSKFVRPRLVFV